MEFKEFRRIQRLLIGLFVIALLLILVWTDYNWGVIAPLVIILFFVVLIILVSISKLVTISKENIKFEPTQTENVFGVSALLLTFVFLFLGLKIPLAKFSMGIPFLLYGTYGLAKKRVWMFFGSFTADQKDAVIVSILYMIIGIGLSVLAIFLPNY
jgi:hypothetical protein